MQSYFNQDDAWLEVDEVLNGNSHEKYNGSEFAADSVSSRMKFGVLATLLIAIVMILGTNLSSSVPTIVIDEHEVLIENSFTVEIPEPEPIKIKPPPKKKIEPPKPKDRKPPTRRKVPEQYASVMSTNVEPRRDMVEDKNREQIAEEAMVREIPQIQTPVIERSDLAVREKVADKIRQVSAVVTSDTVRQYSYSDIEVRNAPTALVSHSQLDPYHYQMIDICLRLCVQSIFLRERVGTASKDYNSDWLKVEKNNNQNNLLFKYRGNWLEFSINKDRLKVLADISFFGVPTNLGSSEELDNLVEDITRKLCDLLNHDECLENL
jgi:hypothetical protein